MKNYDRYLNTTGEQYEKKTVMSYFYGLKNRLRLLCPLGKIGWLTNFKSFTDQPRQILCMPAAGMGDVIMDAPAIQALKQKFPTARLTVLTHYNRGGNDVCRLIKGVDGTIDLGLKSYRWPDMIKFMSCRFWKLLSELRSKNFNLAIVFWPNPLRRILLAALGSKNWIYGNLVDEYPGRQNERLLQPIGIEKTDKTSIFEIPAPTDSETILPKNLKRPLIGIHPFCGTQWRQWDKFDLLQQKLCSLGYTVVTVGRQNSYETPVPVHNLVNKLTIAELFWVIKQLDVFITADSGPMHIAFALDIPTVALFGPIRPQLRMPDSNLAKHAILYKPSPQAETAAHITQRAKPDNDIMQQISVDEVLGSVKMLLKL